jgi:hypothetical protein
VANGAGGAFYVLGSEKLLKPDRLAGNHGNAIHAVDLPAAYGSFNWYGGLAAPTLVQKGISHNILWLAFFHKTGDKYSVSLFFKPCQNLWLQYQIAIGGPLQIRYSYF